MGTIAVNFTHMDNSIYNSRKMQAKYERRLVGNTWRNGGIESPIPELGNDAMRAAFQKCGEEMAGFFAQVYGAFKNGSPRFDTEFWEFYARNGGMNLTNINKFKLPFRADSRDLVDKQGLCQGNINNILSNAIATVRNLRFPDRRPSYILWGAGVVGDENSAGNDDALVTAQHQEEKIVCWQLSLHQNFRTTYGSEYHGDYEVRTATIDISVGVYFKQTFGRYTPLPDGSIMSNDCTCGLTQESRAIQTLSGVTTIFQSQPGGSFEVPHTILPNVTPNSLDFDPFEGSHVPFNHRNPQDGASSNAGSGTVTDHYTGAESTAPPSYESTGPPPPYST